MQGTEYAILFSIAAVFLLVGATIFRQSAGWFILFGIITVAALAFRIYPIEIKTPFCNPCVLFDGEMAQAGNLSLLVIGCSAILGQGLGLIALHIWGSREQTEEAN